MYNSRVYSTLAFVIVSIYFIITLIIIFLILLFFLSFSLTSCIVFSGFLVDILRKRSCDWQNFSVFLSNFFLFSLTPPICFLRKSSSDSIMCLSARVSCGHHHYIVYYICILKYSNSPSSRVHPRWCQWWRQSVWGSHRWRSHHRFVRCRCTRSWNRLAEWPTVSFVWRVL